MLRIIFAILKNPFSIAAVCIIIGFVIPPTIPIVGSIAAFCCLIMLFKKKMNEGKGE